MKNHQKYKIKNIDCALCANRIETELSSNPEVTSVFVDPVNSTIETNIEDISKINQLVKSVEPAAELEEIRDNNSPEPKDKIKKEIIQIALVVVLLLTGTIFKYELREGLFPFADYVFLISAYLLSGWGVLKKAFTNIINGKIFDENSLMTIATIGAILINEIPEAVTVMLFYNIGEFLQGIAVRKSRNSVKSLMSFRPDYANLVIKGEFKRVNPENVKVGDVIAVKPGEKVPLDGVVINGKTYADTFALTGESVPRSIKTGDQILSGMINKTGLITLKVTRVFSESSFNRIISLVEGASKRKAETEKFITKFARYYTPVVVGIAAIVAFFPPLFISGQSLSDWVYRALVMLVVSCPCALVISIPLGYLGGIGGASRKGILIKGSVFLDALTELKTVVFDKTGTLTKGVFKVTDIMVTGGFTREEILKYAAHAEFHSSHPIAKSILEAYKNEINQQSVSAYRDVTGMGIIAEVDGKEVIVGNDSILHEENIKHGECFSEGTVVHIAIDKIYAGYLVVSDELKEKAAYTLERLTEWGIKKIMLTGDNEASSDIIARRLHLDEYYSELLPEDKITYLEKILLENKEGKTAFVGDGINDAPVIARSDIGFAMGGLGSDAAIESSDIVIMQDDPSKIIDAIEIAKKTRMIVWQNILFALGVKIVFIVLGGMGIATMWEAVFGDMGVALVAIINSTRTLNT